MPKAVFTGTCDPDKLAEFLKSVGADDDAADLVKVLGDEDGGADEGMPVGIVPLVQGAATSAQFCGALSMLSVVAGDVYMSRPVLRALDELAVMACCALDAASGYARKLVAAQEDEGARKLVEALEGSFECSAARLEEASGAFGRAFDEGR